MHENEYKTTLFLRSSHTSCLKLWSGDSVGDADEGYTSVWKAVLAEKHYLSLMINITSVSHEEESSALLKCMFY